MNVVEVTKTGAKSFKGLRDWLGKFIKRTYENNSTVSLAMNTDLKTFLDKAEQIQFFSNVGGKLDKSAPRINSWDDWPGPDGNLVAPIHYRQQSLHDEIVDKDQEVQDYWNTLIKFVLDRSKPNIPWVDGEDSWYAPNTAAWHAAWTFSLYAFFLINEVEPPNEIKVQWEWFEKGHWPCAVSEYKDDEPISFVIY